MPTDLDRRLTLVFQGFPTGRHVEANLRRVSQALFYSSAQDQGSVEHVVRALAATLRLATVSGIEPSASLFRTMYLMSIA